MDPQGQLGKVLGIDVRRPPRSAAELLVDSALGTPVTAGHEPGEAGVPGHTRLSRDLPTEELPAQPTRIANLDIVVGNKALALFPSWVDARAGDDGTGRLAACLDASPGFDEYDFVLFDAPPSFGPLTLSVLRACREVVVPCPLTYLALDGCAELMRTIEMVQRRYDHPALEVAMVIPTFYRRTRLADECLARLRDRFPDEIAETVVGYHVKIDEAQSRGLSIFEYAPRDRGAAAMAVLADELLAREPAQRTQRPVPDAQQGADRPRLRAVGSLRDEEVA